MRLTISLTCLLLAACPGAAPPDNGDDLDAGVDGPPPIQSQRLSGKVVDYFSPADTMEAVALTSDGIDPPVMATSATGGLYELASVPIGSKIYFSAARTNYRTTRNPAVSIGDMEVVQDLSIMSSIETTRQYTTTGTVETAGTAFVAAELKKNNGDPFTGLAIDGATPAITLVDAADAIVPGVTVFGFGTTDLIPDDIAVAQLTAVANGKVRVGLLNVPAGQFTLKVSYLDGQNQPKTITAPVVTVAGGATIVVAGGEGGGGGGGGGGGTNPALITNPVFATDIYPLLQKPSAGGLGCASCHTALGTAGGVLQYDLPAADALAAIKARINVIVPTVGTEATSLFLTKPLYEPAPVNHPNATFLDLNDPYYQLFLRWIVQGAL